jgi:hypothetical protein
MNTFRTSLFVVGCLCVASSFMFSTPEIMAFEDSNTVLGGQSVCNQCSGGERASCGLFCIEFYDRCVSDPPDASQCTNPEDSDGNKIKQCTLLLGCPTTYFKESCD